MHKLWMLYCTHYILKDIVIKFNNKELDLRYTMSQTTVGSIEWCMCEMKRHLLLAECKEECKLALQSGPKDSNVCPTCNISYSMDYEQSSKVCKSCGSSISVLLDDRFDFSTRGRFNGNRRHHYDPSEHFAQTICDFTGIGERIIPDKIMEHCIRIVGRGMHVSSDSVFNALKLGGYRQYYLHKYEIANRLRGKNEFHVSSFEVCQMKDVYKRYRQEFIPFQQTHYIGTCSRNGKPRIYWPMRYILKRVCEEIGRGDLVFYIRGVCDKSKLQLYDKYWDMLKTFIDGSRPKRNRLDPSLDSFPLC